MTKAKIVHLVYEIVLGLLAIAVGICFIASCIHIYQSGDNPFTRDRIGEHFQAISIPVYIFLALIVGGIVLNIACPKEEKRTTATIDKSLVLNNLYKRFPLSSAGEKRRQQIKRQQLIRLTFNLIFAVSLMTSIIFCLAFILAPDFISEDPNETVIRGVLAMAVYLLVPLALCITMIFVFRYSYEKELSFLKAAMVEAKKFDPVSENPALQEEHISTLSRIKAFFVKHEKIVKLIVRLVILAVCLVLLITGIANGGIASVLAKANKLCQECIGIG